jgi:hypothetical protein
VPSQNGAPDRWLEEVTPVLREYAEGSAKPVLQAIEDARSKRIEADLDQFLAGAPCVGAKGSHRNQADHIQQ